MWFKTHPRVAQNPDDPDRFKTEGATMTEEELQSEIDYESPISALKP
jgi:hypothetical protein